VGAHGEEPSVEEVTALLSRMSAGDEGAAALLMPAVYERLRALAISYFRNQRSGGTLQPTALVHEAFLRLVQKDAASFKDRAHFFAVAATAMKQILIDRSRRRKAAKRGGDQERVTLDEVGGPGVASQADLYDVADLLQRLGELDARQARIVELRVFGGLTVDEVAELLGLSARTVQNDWRAARAWLVRELGRGEP
jgi:RNA polymerase sigma factor (TIGR02999 family)